MIAPRAIKLSSICTGLTAFRDAPLDAERERDAR
jgi:hypothetical protein